MKNDSMIFLLVKREKHVNTDKHVKREKQVKTGETKLVLNTSHFPLIRQSFGGMSRTN